MNIGAGRLVYQDLPRITKAIEDGTFFENKAFLGAMDVCLSKGSALHLLGLLSDGGVHSHNTHLWAFLDLAARKGLKKVYIHAFLDGRDVSPTSGQGFVKECMEKCRAIGVGKIATVMGRYYGMDRDKRWDRVKRAYDAMVCGEAPFEADPEAAVAKSYAAGVTDEFVEPVVCDRDGMIQPGDAAIFFNFRPDRAREITRALVDPAFDGFARKTACFRCITSARRNMTRLCPMSALRSPV
jgi:2,3-bisphosphoglycerate-independent phosphoglycerate mutase